MLNEIFDIQIQRGRIIIIPLREVSKDDFAPVNETQDSNTLEFLYSLIDEEEGNGWVIEGDGIASYKIRFIYADQLKKKIKQIEEENNLKLDILERSYLDTIVHKSELSIIKKSSISKEDFEKELEEIDLTGIYKRASESINREYSLRRKLYAR